MAPPERPVEMLIRRCESCSLRQLCLPARLPADDLPRLESRLRKTPVLRAGEYLIHAGEPSTAIYVARMGSFKSVRLLDNGEEHVVGFHIRGDLFGLDGLARGEHQVDVMALENSSACVMHAAELDSVLKEVPGLSRQLLNLFSNAVGEHDGQQLIMESHLAEERIARFLLRFVDRLEGRRLVGYEFSMPLSRKDLANYLGLQLPTVSRALGKLRDEGVLAVDRRLISISDPEALYAAANLNRGDVPSPKRPS